MKSDAVLEVGGHSVRVSNLEKVFYPDAGFTKGQVIDFYVKISPILLPHLLARPLSMKRYPDGVEGFHFFEKRCPSHRPDWVETIDADKSDGSKIPYCAINELSALVWAANLADLELHTFLHKAPRLDRPTALVFDLDPGPPSDITTCCQVALLVKELFDSLGIECFAKTSGSKGLQVYVPLNTAVTYEKTKEFAHETALMLERVHPQLIVSRMRKSLREGKVFVDWSQNDEKKTTICAYSLRAKDRPSVSTPVTWEEVRKCDRSGRPLAFGPKEVLARVAKHGDLFARVLTEKQKLPALSVLQRFVPKGLER